MKPRDFQPASSIPPLAAGAIHLWSVDLAPPPDAVTAMRRRLPDAERRRADRFRFDRHRRRFTVRRWRLRQLLGAYRGIEPEEVRFVYGDRDKPALDPELDNSSGPLCFNLSDSGDLAVIAFSHGLELGVDVEILRPMNDARKIAERYFADDERAVLRAVGENRLSEAFFLCWTRKEAYVKAIGEGLAEPLGNFCVSFFPPEPAHFLHIGGSSNEAEAWTLTGFEPTRDAVGALAYRGGPLRVTPLRWAAG
ncbi:MAG: 4'-phosphopantetheinyl transferase superfamily protein [Thermoanaerobaculia bacterium]